MIKESSMGSASERDPKSSQRYLKFGNEKGIGKIVFRAKAQTMSSEVEEAAKFEEKRIFFVCLPSWRDNVFCHHGWQQKMLQINA